MTDSNLVILNLIRDFIENVHLKKCSSKTRTINEQMTRPPFESPKEEGIELEVFLPGHRQKKLKGEWF
ncbi:MAG: hypothetical protein IPI10_01635 [Bacteroidetes bacterium]|nr:hypothetical protein [Bacteroidota bacterium]